MGGLFETVRQAWGMRCPRCMADDQLDIAATVHVRLTPDGTDPDEAECHYHDWGDDTAVFCRACRHFGAVDDFLDEVQA